LIVQDNPDSKIYDKLRDPVLALRPADCPEINRLSTRFAVLDYSPGEVLDAGAYVCVHPGWAYIDLLWVREAKRGKGLGKRLMQRAEQEALQRGCHSAFLWTQDFEAPGFYEKLGYQRFVTFEDFIPGHQRLGFMKRITA
jgi:GNAT superfamily N-acetyltransferase